MAETDHAGKQTPSDTVLSGILDDFETRLRRNHSELVSDDRITAEVRDRCRQILTSVFGVLGLRLSGTGWTGHHGSATPDTAGTGRARKDIHPAAAIEAATELFDAALEPLQRLADAAPARVAGTLHRAIMRCLSPSAIQYVDALLVRIDESRKNERLRISRDLHDLVAHGIVASIQRIELSCRSPDAEQGAQMISTAQDLLKDTLEVVRGLANDLRQIVGDRLITDTVQDLLEDSCHAPLRWTLRSTGEMAHLPPHVKEQAFIVIREAVRNSIQHGIGMRSISAGLTAGDGVFSAVVTDDGAGFRADAIASGGIGLKAMHERMEVLGGKTVIRSSPGTGTTVHISIPMAARPGARS